MTDASPPTDEELKSAIRRLIPNVNLEKTGVNAFVKLLAREYGVDAETLKPRKKFIRDALTEAINEQDDDSDDDDDEEEEEEDDDDDGPPSRAPTSKKTGGGGGGGLSAKKEISPELAKFLGVSDDSQGTTKPVEMARTEIVKSMWEYIRGNNLQNPADRREILLDSKMKEVFGCDMFSMFTMGKYLSAHISPFTPVDLTPKDTGTGGGTRGSKGRAAKRKRSSKGGSPKSKKSKSGGGGGGGNNNYFKNQPPYRLSPALSVVVKADVLPRPQVVKKLWVYIREHNLQNPQNRKEILCDDNFKKIMGGRSKVTMFSMNSFVGDHIIEKADPSEYTRPADDE
eukprot:CAMPEP_0113467544 /NCGR_PEP_ID=MMETSP0014_2-20120614/14869_1 /TAXON_ID=2857 /ORGANISM="Nitzschia sp." /LENGTH=340 /DNA_ID=CAMNT_0000359855 /DNA_START=337 /DNA_END=1359 /DNA_ORIENTATION=+ /assembly_acc=CAM_ASM_000159